MDTSNVMIGAKTLTSSSIAGIFLHDRLVRVIYSGRYVIGRLEYSESDGRLYFLSDNCDMDGNTSPHGELAELRDLEYSWVLTGSQRTHFVISDICELDSTDIYDVVKQLDPANSILSNIIV